MPSTLTMLSSFSTMDVHPSTQSLEPTFHLFASLPPELRLKIWTLSLPAPRLVPLYYLSPTTPPPSPTYNTNWQSLHRSNITTTSQQLHGCTSTSPIPALLHTSRESRALAQEHYTLSFPLAGPRSLFPAKVWFCSSDILYFPSLPGYLASYKSFIYTTSLLSSSSLQSIRRLAVHEDLFVQIRHERGPFDWNINARRRKDVWIERCLRDFWGVVKNRMRGVEEVLFVGRGMEDEIFEEENGEALSREVKGWEEERENNDMDLEMRMMKISARPQQESLHTKVARVVGNVEEMEDWIAPRWKVFSVNDHDDARARNNFGLRRQEHNGMQLRENYTAEDSLAKRMRYKMEDEKRMDVAMVWY